MMTLLGDVSFKKRQKSTDKGIYPSEIAGTAILCLGNRSDETVIRCIITNKNYYYPPYGSKIIFAHEQDYVIVNGCNVSLKDTKNTAFQCWPSFFGDGRTTIYLCIEEFYQKIEELWK